MAKKGRIWTHEETETLIALAEVVPAERIAKRLGRTLKSVEGKASLMGISLKPTTDNLCAQQVADLLGCHQSSISYWIKKGMIPCRRSVNSKQGSWRISRKALKHFYNQNPRLNLWRGVPQESLDWLLD